MKAVVYEKYGPPEVLHFEELEKPIPKENEVLIKIRATTAHIGDTRMRKFDVPRKYWIPMRFYLGLFKPKRKILGMELAGDVETVGENVSRFKPGDKVFALTIFKNFGTYAEYKCLPENSMMSIMPENISYEEAAAIPGGGLTALGLMRNLNFTKGQKILIYGASGSLGTFSIQLAKYYGAKVTAVCSTGNLEMVRSIGADNTIDYTKGDFTETRERFDVVFDAVDKFPKSKKLKLLAPGGKFLSVMDYQSNKPTVEDLEFLKELVESGKFKAVIDKTFLFEEIVEAHRYVDQGHKKGNVAITI